MPKKFRLLKDLPGCPAAGTGKIFEPSRVDNGVYVAYWLEGGRDCECRQLAYPVENNPEWFAPIPDEPERPYPWEPANNEHFFFVSPFDRDRPSQDTHTPGDIDARLFANCGAYRIKEDAELRLKVEPLVNRAVQALINRNGWEPQGGDHVWGVAIQNGRFEPRLYTYATGKYPHVDVADRQDFEDGLLWPLEDNDASKHNADIQAVSALFNFFLTTPHEQ